MASSYITPAFKLPDPFDYAAFESLTSIAEADSKRILRELGSIISGGQPGGNKGLELATQFVENYPTKFTTPQVKNLGYCLFRILAAGDGKKRTDFQQNSRDAKSVSRTVKDFAGAASETDIDSFFGTTHTETEVDTKLKEWLPEPVAEFALLSNQSRINLDEYKRLFKNWDENATDGLLAILPLDTTVSAQKFLKTYAIANLKDEVRALLSGNSTAGPQTAVEYKDELSATTTAPTTPATAAPPLAPMVPTPPPTPPPVPVPPPTLPAVAAPVVAPVAVPTPAPTPPASPRDLIVYELPTLDPEIDKALNEIEAYQMLKSYLNECARRDEEIPISRGVVAMKIWESIQEGFGSTDLEFNMARFEELLVLDSIETSSDHPFHLKFVRDRKYCRFNALDVAIMNSLIYNEEAPVNLKRQMRSNSGFLYNAYTKGIARACYYTAFKTAGFNDTGDSKQQLQFRTENQQSLERTRDLLNIFHLGFSDLGPKERELFRPFYESIGLA